MEDKMLEIMTVDTFKVRAHYAAEFIFDPSSPRAAMEAAVAWARERDFAVGGMQHDAPRGLMYPAGDHQVAEWQEMGLDERKSCHGWILTSPGDGSCVLLTDGPWLASVLADKCRAAIRDARRQAAERAGADRPPREPTEPAGVADPRLIWQPVEGGHVSMIRDVGGFFEVAYIPDTDDFFDSEFEASVFRFELTDEAAARAYAQELIDARPLPARPLTQAELDAWSEGPLGAALEVEGAAERDPFAGLPTYGEYRELGEFLASLSNGGQRATPPVADLPAYDVELIEQELIERGSGDTRKSYRVFAPSPRAAAEMALWLFERRLRPLGNVLAKVWATSARRDPQRSYPSAPGDAWWEAWREPPLVEIALWASEREGP